MWSLRQRPTIRGIVFTAVSIATLFSLALAAMRLAVATVIPSSGTITEANPNLTYRGGPLAVAAASGSCPDDAARSESFELTVELPADFDARRPDDSLRIAVGPVDSADMVLTLAGADGTVLASADTNVFGVGEVVWTDAQPGTALYRVRTCTFAGSAAAYDVAISLVAMPPPPPPPPLPGLPHHVTLAPPQGLGERSGEPSIGYNLKTRRAMFIADLQTLKVTPPEHGEGRDAAGEPLPSSCPATWTDVSFPMTGAHTFDPILFTDQTLGEQVSGRTFVSQSLNASSLFAYTDDDGASWVPAQHGPPNGGVDHQSVAAGPYPAPSATFAGAPPGNPGYAVYFCSQADADAFCARSDSGGQAFGPGVPMGKATSLGCSAGDFHSIHGHARVAPDGALAIPLRICSGQQGFMLSTDAATTFAARKVPGTTSGKTDPQLAWSRPGRDGRSRGYFCLVDGDGRPKASVTADRGLTWSPLTDLGAQHGVRNAVFAQAIAGDAERAACAFLGTRTAGEIDSREFAGTWYAYLSYTFDGGGTWTTIDVTPGDPVQKRAGICTLGLDCSASGNAPRNLLDFNELTLDERGRVWFAYADGCVNEACIGSPDTPNDNARKATIARQVGGRSLYAEFDASIGTGPQAPCLRGSRDLRRAALGWTAPDAGGEPITGYKVYRASQPGGPYALIGTTAADKTGFDDFTVVASTPAYFYRVNAVSAAGDGRPSNLLEQRITVEESACVPPGLTILADAAGDATDRLAEHDLRSFSLAQPDLENGAYMLSFHLRMGSLQTLTENTHWSVNFCASSVPCQDPNKDYGAVNKFFTVRLTTVPPASAATPALQLLQPTAVGVTRASRAIAAPREGSGYWPDGRITWLVDAADLGFAHGRRGTDRLYKFQSRVEFEANVIRPAPDNMPNDLAGAGEFVTLAAAACGLAPGGSSPAAEGGGSLSAWPLALLLLLLAPGLIRRR